LGSGPLSRTEERNMHRASLILLGLTLTAGCRTADKPAGSGQPAGGTRTASPYSTGSDTAARNSRLEGTNTGAALQAPPRIPAMLVTLDAAAQPGKAPSEGNLTALRTGVSSLEAAMRADFTRAGEADTGAFHALSDSIARQLGGGAGGVADKLDRPELQQVTSQVRRLIDLYQQRMKAPGKQAQ
jgi:hypothetical protein